MNRVKVQDKIIKVLLLLLLISSCKEENKDLIMNISEETILENTLKSQLEGGNSREYQIYEYSENDLNVIIPILKKELKKMT